MEQDPQEKVKKLGDKKESAKEQSLLLADAVDINPDVEEIMPRPCKKRRVRGRPNSSYFKPSGIRIVDLEESELAIEEFEAIRLIDFKETSQKKASQKMQISQPTLSRILKSARRKVADAITNGKAIKIQRSE
jgi:uncharacterized protein